MSNRNMNRNNYNAKSISSDSRDSFSRDSSSNMNKRSVNDQIQQLTQKVDQLQRQNNDLYNQSQNQSNLRNHNRSQNNSSSSSFSRADQERIRDLEEDVDAKLTELNVMHDRLRSKKYAFNTLNLEKASARESMLEFRDMNTILRGDIVQSNRNNTQLERQLDQESDINTSLNRSLMNSFNTNNLKQTENDRLISDNDQLTEKKCFI